MLENTNEEMVKSFATLFVGFPICITQVIPKYFYEKNPSLNVPERTCVGTELDVPSKVPGTVLKLEMKSV